MIDRVGSRAVTYPPPTATFGQAITVSGSGFWAFPSGSAVNAVRVEIVAKPPASRTYGTGIPRYADLGVYQIVDTAGASRTQQIFQDVRVDRIEYPPGVGVAFDCGEGVSVRLTEVLGALAIGNPTQVGLSLEASYSPHPYTERWTYTVPANREASLQTISGTMTRNQPQSSDGGHAMYATITPPGLPPARVFVLLEYDAFPARSQTVMQTPNLFLPAGVVVEGATLDDAVGGAVSYFLVATFREYDAGTLTPSGLNIRSFPSALESATE